VVVRLAWVAGGGCARGGYCGACVRVSCCGAEAVARGTMCILLRARVRLCLCTRVSACALLHACAHTCVGDACGDGAWGGACCCGGGVFVPCRAARAHAPASPCVCVCVFACLCVCVGALGVSRHARLVCRVMATGIKRRNSSGLKTDFKSARTNGGAAQTDGAALATVPSLAGGGPARSVPGSGVDLSMDVGEACVTERIISNSTWFTALQGISVATRGDARVSRSPVHLSWAAPSTRRRSKSTRTY
jgi:hypothetical protein